jgi:hypothetical protein
MLFPENGKAREYYCVNHHEIVVTTENSAGHERICTAAGKALEFLARFDLYPKRTIRFKIVETLILSEGYDAFGRYDIQSEVLDPMSYQAIFAHVNLPECMVSRLTRFIMPEPLLMKSPCSDAS